jgi:hypothetical protein
MKLGVPSLLAFPHGSALLDPSYGLRLVAFPHGSAALDPSYGSRDPSPVTHDPSPVTRHPSPVTRHPSPVTGHRSPVSDRRMGKAKRAHADGGVGSQGVRESGVRPGGETAISAARPALKKRHDIHHGACVQGAVAPSAPATDSSALLQRLEPPLRLFPR